jgi:hypothetical protein
MSLHLADVSALDNINSKVSIPKSLSFLKPEYMGTSSDFDLLHKMLPAEWWGGWTFSEKLGDVTCFKHGITRNYINIDKDGNCVAYMGNRKGWVIIDKQEAIEAAYRGLEEMGETRESKVDADYRARKLSRIEELGITVVE